MWGAPVRDFYVQQALNRYYDLPQDGRSLATGGTTHSFCKDSGCIYMNPAGLGLLERDEVSASVGTSLLSGEELLTENRIEQSEVRGYLTVAIALGEREKEPPQYGTLSFGYSRYKGETDDSINTTPDGHRRSLAYGISVSDDLALGYGFTFYDDQLHSDLADLHSHARLLHNFGAIYKISKEWELAALFGLGVGQSDTEDYIYKSDGLSRPRQYTGNVGVARHYDTFSGFVAFDYSRLNSEGNLQMVSSPVVIGNKEEGDLYNLRVGAESLPFNGFIFRGGLRWFYVSHYAFDREDLKGLSGRVQGGCVSAGLGYLFGEQTPSGAAMRLDYGVQYSATGRGDWEHLISAAIPF